MKNFTSSSFPLLLWTLFSSLACTKAELDVKPTLQETIEQNLKIELNATLHPLSTTDPSLPVNDLAFLGNLGNAKIVGMGEATHGSQEHCIAAFAQLQRLRGKRVPGRVVGRASDQRLGQLDVRGDHAEGTDGLRHNLRPDSITGQNSNFRHNAPMVPRGAFTPPARLGRRKR